MAGEFLTAVALILVIEGALYALFPQPMKKLLLHVLGMPVSSMRIAGLVSAGAGVFLVWLLRG
ncbi:MAG: DUF2065 family protein [Alphaproteobacteria bacterium]|nr:DUF2065 family protein [Alphaproteobacteria bacterium]